MFVIEEKHAAKNIQIVIQNVMLLTGIHIIL